MASLRFSYGTMSSGKSTLALQIHHNLRRRGLRGTLLTQLDRRGAEVSSRLGISAEATQVDAGMNLRTHVVGLGKLDYVVCDEAQFYEPVQIEQLARLVDDDGIDVYAFGLLTTFQGSLFPGTARLLELADERVELNVEARCWCGQRATHNARLIDGVQTLDGEMKVMGDTVDAADPDDPRLELDSVPEITYEVLCRQHWIRGQPEPPVVDLTVDDPPRWDRSADPTPADPAPR